MKRNGAVPAQDRPQEARSPVVQRWHGRLPRNDNSPDPIRAVLAAHARADARLFRIGAALFAAWIGLGTTITYLLVRAALAAPPV